MARYDYDCAACGHRFEVAHGVFEDGPTACPLCGAGPVRKAFSPPTIHFKGSGWAKKERQASTASRASRAAGAAETAGGSADSTSATGDAPTTSDGPSAGTADKAEPSSKVDGSDKPATPAAAAAGKTGGIADA